ncbi:protein EMSY-LIKE 3-like isoform X2 [Tasmannia lanceolata]|uniref:protein EMSY-LIKE 3-like isoform X2 n=1 Tax=Tasmannia lanceolata TaxID=3420 RepID=UPI004063BE58
MDYDLSDSSGTDDDLPPSHQNRVTRVSRVTGNGRTAVGGTLPFSRIHNDMETQIHRLEQEAYSSVLRAFKAQSDSLSWEKEGLITELRKELRVSDEEHRDLLSRVKADDILRRIREWRKAGGVQPGLLSTSQPVHDTMPSPTVSASRKKQKTSQSMPSLSLGAPSPALHQPTIAPSLQPSSSVAKRGATVGSRGKKPKAGQTLPGVPSMKSVPYPSMGPTGRGQVANRGPSGALVGNEPAEAATYDPLVGRKVMTRWPEDNNFYEAVITDYNPEEGLHALVYDMNTTDETWEWVNLKEISPEDIRWEGEDPGISRRTARGGPGRGIKKPLGRGSAVPGAGRGRGAPKNQSKKDFPPSQNGIGKKGSDDIEILHTDTLIKEVERVFSASHPDPLEIEKAKKVLKEHEQALVDAIARLADASDGESGGEHQFSHGQSMDRERGWRNRQYGGGNQHVTDFENVAGEGRGEGSDGDQMAGDGRVASDDQPEGDEDI